MKKCFRCDTEKENSEFANNSSKPDGLQAMCRQCKKSYDAQYHQQNKARQVARNSYNRKKLKAEINEYKQKIGCKYCPENNPVCLDFHHKNDDKLYNISRIVSGVQKTKTWAEVAKCEVVCANCHRKLHAGLI
jgi:hypothetical protein